MTWPRLLPPKAQKSPIIKPQVPRTLFLLQFLKSTIIKGLTTLEILLGVRILRNFSGNYDMVVGHWTKKKVKDGIFARLSPQKKLEGSTKFPWGLKSQTTLVKAVTPSPPPFPSILLYAWLPFEQCIQTTLMIIQVAFMTSMYDEVMLPFRK